MLLDYHDSFNAGPITKATRVVIYDSFNNPIALFFDNLDNTITCYTAGDADFASVLKQYGITPPIIKKLTIGG